VILENPADFRAKLRVNVDRHSIPLDIVDQKLFVVDEPMAPNELFDVLRADSEKNGGFQAVIVDTWQAFFRGSDFNNNAEILASARRLRKLTTLPGKPSVLVAAHPTKGASAQESLEPFGGGSAMNELDGNLTLQNNNGLLTLWWTKVRGPMFDPREFRLEKHGSPNILDNKGRTPLMPVVTHITTRPPRGRRTKKSGWLWPYFRRSTPIPVGRKPTGPQRPAPLKLLSAGK
jgi:hypothetical protein